MPGVPAERFGDLAPAKVPRPACRGARTLPSDKLQIVGGDVQDCGCGADRFCGDVPRRLIHGVGGRDRLAAREGAEPQR